MRPASWLSPESGGLTRALGMDQRAVVALVVVLDRDLPVRRDRSDVSRRRRAARTPSSPAARAATRGAPRTVTHRPTRSRTATHPTPRASREQRDGRRIEVLGVEPGRESQAAVELVAPRVVRALHDALLTTLVFVAPSHGSSSWPRWRHAFAKTCSAPSRSRVRSSPAPPIARAPRRPARAGR